MARSIHGPDESPTPTYSKSTPNTRNSVKPEDAFSPLPPPRRKQSMASRARSPSPMRQHTTLHTISPSPSHSPPPPTALHLITQPSLPPPTVPLPSIPTSVSEPTDHHIIEEEEIVSPTSQNRSISSSSSIDSLQDSTTPSSHQTTPVLEKENIHVNQDHLGPSPTLPIAQQEVQSIPPKDVATTATALQDNKSTNRIIPPQRKVSLQNAAMIYSASLPIPQKKPINEEPFTVTQSTPPLLQRTSSVQTFPSMFGRSTNSVLVRNGSIPMRSSSQSHRPSIAQTERIGATGYYGKQQQQLPKRSPQDGLDQLDSNSLPEPFNLPVIGAPLHLFKALESSMTQGAYLSRKLYVPKKLW
jgi:hypothetical protein